MKLHFLKNLVFTFLFLIPFFIFGNLALAQSEEYFVGFEDDIVTSGQTIIVNWETPEERSSSAWVGLYEIGADDRKYKTWKYLPKTGTSGEIALSFKTVGTYEVRLFSDGGYKRVAVSSESLTIKNLVVDNGETGGGNEEEDNEEEVSARYEISTRKNSYNSGESIVVNFTTPSPRPANTSNAWVGLYETGADDRKYKTWKYLPKTGTSGEIALSFKTVGTYEVRLFSDGGYKRVAVSSPFTIKSSSNGDISTPPSDNTGGGSTVYNLNIDKSNIEKGGTITVGWQAPATANLYRDWIGLYKVGSSNYSYSAYKYTGGIASGSTTFKMDRVGAYEFRYFKNNGFTRVAISPTFSVSDTETGSDLQCALSNTSLQKIINYPPRTGQIIAFGDSLTAGVGAISGQDYVSQLSRKSGVPIVNAGVSGNTTRDALVRLNRDVLTKDPSVVLVWLGGNDILQRYYEDVFTGAENPNLLEVLRLMLLRITGKLPAPQGITEAETFANLKEVVERIQVDGATVILIGFSGGVFDADLETKYKQVADQTGAIYVPNVMSGIIGRPTLMSDLVHPNGTGYGLVADKVLPYFACVMPR